MCARAVTGGGGVDLHVEETGNPRGRPVLFMHGFSQSRLSWARQLHSGLADDLRLVALDMRGHGLSGKPRDAYGDSALWAEDIANVIAALALDRPILCGWSYGGYIIADYLRAYGQERLGGVHLVAAATKMGTPEAAGYLGRDFLALAPGFFATDVEESVRAMETFVRLCVRDPLPAADLYTTLGYNMVVSPHVRRALFSRVLDNDDVLRALRLPVLITHGLEDRIVLPRASEHYATLIPAAQTSFYPDVGHTPFWEDAPRFNRELAAFAQSI